jgi:hypothetical protein
LPDDSFEFVSAVAFRDPALLATERERGEEREGESERGRGREGEREWESGREGGRERERGRDQRERGRGR